MSLPPHSTHSTSLPSSSSSVLQPPSHPPSHSPSHPPSTLAYDEVESLSDDEYDFSDDGAAAAAERTTTDDIERDNEHLFISALIGKTLDDVRDVRVQIQTITARLRDAQERLDVLQRKEKKKRIADPPPKKRSKPHRLSANDVKKLRAEVDKLSEKLTDAGKFVETFAALAEPTMGARTEGLNEADARKEYKRLRYQFRNNMHRFLTTERDRMKLLCAKYGI